jgi:hypothetical protein
VTEPTGDEFDRGEPEAELTSDQERVDTLVFKTCVGALWADGTMAAPERDHVSHIIDSIATSETTRDEFRRLALHGVNRHELWTEIDRLDETDKLHLFDRCVELLTSDRRVRRKELRFLGELRRHCDIGLWRFQRVVWRLARMRRWLLVLAGVSVLVAVYATMQLTAGREQSVPPTELPQHFAIALPRVPALRQDLAPEALFQQVRRSVVAVNVTIDGTHHGHGSGLVIGVDQSGQLYVLTNRHVVFHMLHQAQVLSFDIELEGGVRLPGLLDFYSRIHDLAVLVVPGITGWALPVPLLPKDQLRVGQQVYAVGSPIGLHDSFTSGVISALRSDFIQTDATVHAGSSGGPLFDATGMVCGVITTTHQHKDLSFAVYADAVFDMLTERHQTKTNTPSDSLS